MVIRKIEFLGSAVSQSQYPKDGLPEIVLCGRSNVGKSSFINAMLNHSKIARVSQTPGKTRLVNFFRINEMFHFVDIPGYGFAQVSQEMKLSFAKIIEEYLSHSPFLRLGILLLDMRRTPNADDLLMQRYFLARQIPVFYVLTKADKLSSNERQKQQSLIRKTMNLSGNESMIIFSSVTKENRDLLWDRIEEVILTESE